MSDVFDITETAGTDFFREAVIDAAYELGLVTGALPRPSRRMRLLLDALVGYGVLARDRDAGYRPAAVPPRPAPPAYKGLGWGAIADVIRRDEPLPPGDRDATARMHLHLATAGAVAAEETARLLGARGARQRLLDLGGGAGAYTAAFLAAHPDAHATLVDVEDVVPLAMQHLAGYGARVDFVASDICDAKVSDTSVALLANVVHLHGAAMCARMFKVAASAVVPGGIVAIKDLRMDVDAAGVRVGPLQSLLFALNMGVYTKDGDVHETSLLRDWLTAAGLVDIEEHRLATSPGSIVVLGRKP